MFTIHSFMLVSLGFLLAVLLGFVIAPAYWARAVRLTSERIRRNAPMSEAEIRAERDKLRAEHAVRVHRLEAQSERDRLSAARQRIEINRRDGVISNLERKVKELNTNLAASDNARRVLEQTIVDRVPKIEARLIETRKLLKERDEEVAAIKADASKTFQALDEAMQINAQQRSEIDRMRTSLVARATVEPGETGAPRQHGTEIALRSELEELRARTRDQATMIARLQDIARAREAQATAASKRTPPGHDAPGRDSQPASAKILQLGNPDAATAAGSNDGDLADTGEQTVSTRASLTTESLQAEVGTLKAANREQALEIEKLKAALKVFEEEAAAPEKAGFGSSLRDSKVAMRARLSSAEREIAQQSDMLKRLRAELAAANDRLARQATQHRDELRRLGSGTVPTSVRSRGSGAASTTTPQKKAAEAAAAPGTREPSRRPSLARRIVEEFPEKAAALQNGKANGTASDADANEAGGKQPAAASETALGVTASSGTPSVSAASASTPAEKKPRRTGLMDRIAGITKG